MTINTKNTRKHIKHYSHQETKKLKNLKGGKKLGEGSFGCVIVPNIKCIGSKIKYNSKIKTVSKLVGFKNKEDLKDLHDEIRINELIKSFDPTNKYFITILEHCKINTNDKDSIETRDNLSVQNYDYNADKYNKCILNKNRLNYNLIMPFAGLDLIDIINEEKKICIDVDSFIFDIDNLSKHILDLSLQENIRIHALELYYKQNKDDTIELISRITGMYQFSGTKIIQNFLKYICISEIELSAFLKLECAKSLLSFYEFEEDILKDDDEEMVDIKTDSNTQIKIRNSQRKELESVSCLIFS